VVKARLSAWSGLVPERYRQRRRCDLRGEVVEVIVLPLSPDIGHIQLGPQHVEDGGR
jgi:hypothetical protein